MTESNADDEEAETVWIAETGKRNGQLYHTDLNCKHIPENPRERRKVTLKGFRECKYCAGEDVARSAPNELYEAALEWDGDLDE